MKKGNIFFAKFYVDSKHCGAIGTFCTSCTVYRTREAKHMYLASCPNIVIICAYEQVPIHGTIGWVIYSTFRKFYMLAVLLDFLRAYKSIFLGIPIKFKVHNY